jgi:hypothetical protein
MSEHRTTTQFDRVHAVCARLRDKPCKLCPATFHDPLYGKVIHGCYALAAETVNIAVHGNPWGAGPSDEAVKAWQERFNRE